MVDDTGLIEALREGRIGGAALDVFVTQPLPPDHPYFAFDNVIITPHMAGITEESMMRMGDRRRRGGAARARQPPAGQSAQPRGGGSTIGKRFPADPA